MNKPSIVCFIGVVSAFINFGCVFKDEGSQAESVGHAQTCIRFFSAISKKDETWRARALSFANVSLAPKASISETNVDSFQIEQKEFTFYCSPWKREFAGAEWFTFKNCILALSGEPDYTGEMAMNRDFVRREFFADEQEDIFVILSEENTSITGFNRDAHLIWGWMWFREDSPPAVWFSSSWKGFPESTFRLEVLPLISTFSKP